MGKKITVTKEIELTDYQFQCEGCKEIKDQSIYCTAQLAMGHGMNFTCECGHKTYFEPMKPKR